MYYCGIIPMQRGSFQLCALEERSADEAERLEASFYEPGPASEVADAVDELGQVVVAVAAAASEPVAGHERRLCDELLAEAGVAPAQFDEQTAAIFSALSGLESYRPDGEPGQGTVEAAGSGSVMVETSIEGVFCSFQERRLPARRHPLGVLRRVTQLVDRRVADGGGDLWHRRIEEIEAAAAALCAHELALGQARWLGDPAEGVIVLPGSGELGTFATDGVLPPVTRVPLAGTPAEPEQELDEEAEEPRRGMFARLRRSAED
jgi:hypothetical protein